MVGMTRFVLVGGSGPLGQFLADYLTLTGHKVAVWSRSESTNSRTVDVLAPVDPETLSNFDALIYLAWDTRDRRQSVQQAHAIAAAEWSAAAESANVKFLFMSSTLAAEGSQSNYGHAKWVAEQEVLRHGAVVLRIGLVCDDAYGLLATKLRRSMLFKRFAFLAPNVLVHPVSSQTVGAAVARLAGAQFRSSVVWVADSAGTPLATIIGYPRPIKSAQKRRDPRFARNFLRVLAGKVSYADRLLGVLEEVNPSESDLASSMEISHLTPWSDSLYCR